MVLDLSEIMQRWLAARGVALPTEEAPAPELPPGEQLALPLAFDGPDRGVELIPLGPPLRIYRRARTKKNPRQRCRGRTGDVASAGSTGTRVIG
jgi:hypothetical protein